MHLSLHFDRLLKPSLMFSEEDARDLVCLCEFFNGTRTVSTVSGFVTTNYRQFCVHL
jgi:hypothetical protein